MSQSKISAFIGYFHLALICTLSIIGCAKNEFDRKEWIGVFMFDSVTAGAVRLEYHESSPDGNTFGDVEQSNVHVDLFKYDFVNKILYKDRRLFKNMGDAGIYRSTEYNYPYLLQGGNYNNGDDAVLFNLESGEKRILRVRMERLSYLNTHIYTSYAILNINTLDTLEKYEEWGRSIYLYSDKHNKILISFTTRENTRYGTIYNSRFQIKTPGDSAIIEMPEFKLRYSRLLGVNWQEGWVGFSGDSTNRLDNYICNIDSIFNSKNSRSCVLAPSGLNKVNYVVGSTKTNNFMGIVTDGVGVNGLYACTGKDTCDPVIVSQNEWIER